MSMPKQELTLSKKNLLCNFRAPNEELFNKWLEFKEYVASKGLDICRVVIPLTEAFMVAGKNAELRTAEGKIINVQMQNNFLYEVSKPRRTPHTLEFLRSNFRRTFSTSLYEAYVLNKARQIKTEFSFRDFLEIEPAAFHRIIRRLKRKGLIVANPSRTIPRFYFLAENLSADQLRLGQT